MSFRKPYYKYASNTVKKNNSTKSAPSQQGSQKTQWKITPEYIQQLHEQQAFYLGQRGFTLIKSLLAPEDILQIKQELFKIPKNSLGKQNQEDGFPLYRENEKKLYVPRFYGLERYGTPKKTELTEGDPIDANCQFIGNLLPHQVEAIRVYTDHIKKNGATFQTGGILELPCGYGKCLAKDTPVLMADGRIEKVQHIVTGDLLMGDDSTPRTVLSICRGREKMYEIRGEGGNGGNYTVNESHILSLYSKSSGEIRDISLKEYLDDLTVEQRADLWGFRKGVDWKETPVEIEPYLLGLWLGGGDENDHHILWIRDEPTNAVINHLMDVLSTKNDVCIQGGTSKEKTGWGKYRVENTTGVKHSRKNPFLAFLHHNGLALQKHIPKAYLHNSRKIRQELLAGILDSQATVSESGKMEIRVTEMREFRYIEDIQYLIRSLGIPCSNIEHKSVRTWTDTYYDYVIHVSAACAIHRFCPTQRWRIHTEKDTYKDMPNYQKLIETPGRMSSQDLQRCSQEMDNFRREQAGIDIYPIQVVAKPENNYYGFEIDGNRRFLLGDFTVTHNTVLTIKIIAELEGKTIILVHKEFLMNQWIERIRQFMPNARIGILQGPKCEIEGRDIVIGMIQSIYNKEFPTGTFDSFRLTVIDEVHRIGSCEFSKTLAKLPTKYMLGVSATVDRKDGLTDVLYMYIGPKIHSIRRAHDEVVLVRAVEYSADDEEFNRIEYDYTGRVKHSTMISKLCTFSPRSDFVIRMIRDLFDESPEKQMIVLCHNRCLLVYLYDALQGGQHNGGPTVGYYVGGMKQADLAISETKQVVLATYAMAAEALDIKTLSTLLLISPKTDIIQSVGRILRTKHNNPLIIDVIDEHACFKNQWVKRRQYYKKCNYKIVKTTNREYPSGWKTLFEPNTLSNGCKTAGPVDEGNDSANEEELETKDPLFNIDSIVF